MKVTSISLCLSYYSELKQIPGPLKANESQLWLTCVEKKDNGKFASVKERAGDRTLKISKALSDSAAQSPTEITPEEEEAVADAAATGCPEPGPLDRRHFSAAAATATGCLMFSLPDPQDSKSHG